MKKKIKNNKTNKANRYIISRTKIRMSTKLWKPEDSTMIYLKSSKKTKINLEFCMLCKNKDFFQ